MKRTALVLAFLATAPAVWAQNVVSVDPAGVDNPALTPGTTFVVTLKVDVNEPGGLLAASLSLDYDPNVLVLQGATPGDFYSSPFILANWETSAGHFFHEALSMGNWVYQGTYTIVTVEFYVMSVGSTAITVGTGDDAAGTFTVPFFINGANEIVEAAGATGGSFTNVPPPAPPAPPPPPSPDPDSGPSVSSAPSSPSSSKSGGGRDGCGGSAGRAGGTLWTLIAIAACYFSRRSRRATSSDVCESPSV